MQPVPLDADEARAWHAFLGAHSRVFRLLEAELLAEHGLSLPAYEVLAHLSTAPVRRLRMADLADCALLTPSGLTRLVDKLERDGLVQRERCRDDGRVVYAVLTDAGARKLTEAYPTHLRGVRAHMIDLLDRDDLRALSCALAKLGAPGVLVDAAGPRGSAEG